MGGAVLYLRTSKKLAKGWLQASWGIERWNVALAPEELNF